MVGHEVIETKDTGLRQQAEGTFLGNIRTRMLLIRHL